jgi:hypothetical protein
MTPAHYDDRTDLRVAPQATLARAEALLDLAKLRKLREKTSQSVDTAKDIVRAATQLADGARFPGAIARTQQTLGRCIAELDVAKRIHTQATTCFDYLAERVWGPGAAR